MFRVKVHVVHVKVTLRVTGRYLSTISMSEEVLWLSRERWLRALHRRLWCVRVHDDDMAFLEVVNKRMQVAELQPTAGVVTAHIILTLEHTQGVCDGPAVTLY